MSARTWFLLVLVCLLLFAAAFVAKQTWYASVTLCLTEGKTGIVPKKCCPNLSPMSISGTGSTAGKFICTNCGDGWCGRGETALNCKGDCGCIKAGGVPTTGDVCCKGLVQRVNSDPPNKDFQCNNAPRGKICIAPNDGFCSTGENYCNSFNDCGKCDGVFRYLKPVAWNYTPYYGLTTARTKTASCCEGLTKIPFSMPTETLTETKMTYFKTALKKNICTNWGGSVCTRCGDGVCKPPESFCNCPQDCASCTKKGEMITKQGLPADLTWDIYGMISYCCDGLVAVENKVPGDSGSCLSSAPKKFFCVNASDGLCGDGENRCNSLRDCP